MKQMPALPNAELLALLKKTLARGAPFRFTATGSSMIPFVRDGDEITVSPLGGAAPRIGDVVALRRRGAGLALRA